MTKQLIRKKTPIICEASFSQDGLFCSVDILKNIGKKHVELYEVKSSSHIHDIYLDDIAFQVYVLHQCGYQVDRACLVYINNGYERIGELDLSGLFRIEDLTAVAYAKQPEVEANVESFRTVLRKRKEPYRYLAARVKPYHMPAVSFHTVPAICQNRMSNCSITAKAWISFQISLKLAVLIVSAKLQAERNSMILLNAISKQIRSWNIWRMIGTYPL